MGFDLATDLAARRRQHRYRQARIMDGPSGRHALLGGRQYLNFCSNDYLGLANDPAVVAAFQQGAADWGVGSGASHLVCGHQRPHQQLEEALAAHTGRQRALLFSTGYMANLGVMTALLSKGDAVFQDRLNHASLLDGGLLSGARFRRFPHNDGQALASQLARSEARRKLVVVDGVFSMDGDEAPLVDYAEACEGHDAWLMVDDAHGIGVLDAQGRGSVFTQGVNERVPVLMGTLGKGLGTAGAFVAGSDELIETLIQFARTFIYTTAMPAAVASATLVSLRKSREENWRRDTLAELIARFRQGARALGYTLMPSQTPIQPLLIGSDVDATALSEALREKGFLITAIRPPTVPEGEARLRVTLSAAHEVEDVDALLAALAQCQPQDV
ncbi:8-amino-7-oxononanoate synthase [Alcanivorax sp. 97CO-5]|uniref:8-amino-7-oxononanoate synthase n=1 Tax=unclassified Alcanivorax TaxID=2638842 RepID=UPI0003E7EAB1|nr:MULTISPECIES: 8-amino-7-oxononanoate synthase [unclassified Alcanivorax]EUC68648.1 8-amino-7-oxononanoate synthase [Alcanivorax sp. 97CO-5]PKG01046.1 8-amino-7-oxononanoate synthase [Alcanivorax sp. 97CO-6]